MISIEEVLFWDEDHHEIILQQILAKSCGACSGYLAMSRYIVVHQDEPEKVKRTFYQCTSCLHISLEDVHNQ